MSSYHNYYSPDLVFVTCKTVNREAVLVDEAPVHLMRVVLNQVKRAYPFQTFGYVFLPDHFHLLVKIAQGGSLRQILYHVTNQYSKDYQMMMGIPGKMTIWQRQHGTHRVQGEDDFAKYLDQIHYDPVQHGHVARPEEWLHSSYERWVERRIYTLGWGWTAPKTLQARSKSH